ncbi:MAG: hypothetical protein OXG94_01035 [Bacteroidetes bacterium]|nr:hypothetical protein [Bacteroidota bacterium]
MNLSNAEMETPETPEFTRIVELLKDSGLKDHKAVELAERMSNLASQNTIAQFGSKLDALAKSLEAKIDAQKEAQNAKYNVLIWMIGFATAIISAVILFGNSGG